MCGGRRQRRRGRRCRSRPRPGRRAAASRTARDRRPAPAAGAAGPGRLIEYRSAHQQVVDERPGRVPGPAVHDPCPTASTGPQLGEEAAERLAACPSPLPGVDGRAAVTTASSASSTRELEAARSGVDDEDPHRLTAGRPRSSRGSSGQVLAVRRARTRRCSVMLVDASAVAGVGRRRVRSRGTRSMTSMARSIAVEVVQHAPCRTAWSWCLPPCSRGRGGCRGWSGGRSAGGSARVAVVGEDDRPVGGELARRTRASDSPCGCSRVVLQPHQVDDVDHPDPQVGEVPAQDLDRGEGLQRRARRRRRPRTTSGSSPASVLGPVPDPEAAGCSARPRRRSPGTAARLLARHDDVHVVPAAQAVVGDRQQACWRPAAGRPG